MLSERISLKLDQKAGTLDGSILKGWVPLDFVYVNLRLKLKFVCWRYLLLKISIVLLEYVFLIQPLLVKNATKNLVFIAVDS